MQTCGGEKWRAPLVKATHAFIALLTTVALVACSGGVVLEPTEGPVLEARKVARAATPTDPVTAIEPGNPAEVALHSSQLFFESAQVVVLASSSENAAIPRAASVAISMGTPLLLTAPEGENIAGKGLEEQEEPGVKTGGLNTELLRLGTRAILTVGEVSLHQLDTTSLVVQPVPDDDGDLEEILGTQVDQTAPPDPGHAVEALTTLDSGEIYAAPDLGRPSTAYGTLPKTLPAERNERVTVFTGSSTHYYAGVATARAAGAHIFVGDDPASVTEVVDHLALHPSRPVVGLGEEFLDPQSLQRMVASMHAGQLLPSGAQRVFRANGEEIDVVTVDAAQALGRKGIDNAADVLEQAKGRAERAASVTGRTSVPGVEVSTAENSRDELTYWVNQAEGADQYLVLNIRPKSNVLEAVTAYEDLLGRANVGVRVDVSARDDLDAGEVNDAVVYLRRFVREERLPQRLFIVDLGRSTEIANPDSLITAGGEVALTFSVDDGETAHWRRTRELFEEAVNWGVNIAEVDESSDDDDEGTIRKYPKVEDVSGKDEADLMTYR